jgi:hypothetical protein
VGGKFIYRQTYLCYLSLLVTPSPAILNSKFESPETFMPIGGLQLFIFCPIPETTLSRSEFIIAIIVVILMQLVLLVLNRWCSHQRQVKRRF